MTSLVEFIEDEGGAVTIDWVALAAGILILGVSIIPVIGPEFQNVIDNTERKILEADDLQRIS